MRRFMWIACCAVSLVSAAASATPVTIGSLSSDDDGSTAVITDSLNNREWLRWNQLLGKTLAQTQAELITSGSVAYGFQVARIADAQLFVDALLGPANNYCTTSGSGVEDCWQYSPLAASYISLTGDNYIVSPPANSEFNGAFFLSDNGTGNDVGYLELWGTGPVRKMNEWGTFTNADNFAAAGYQTNSIGITWLLYRDLAPPVTSVPDPGSTVMLLGLGLLGTALRGLGERRQGGQR